MDSGTVEEEALECKTAKGYKVVESHDRLSSERTWHIEKFWEKKKKKLAKSPNTR